MTRRRWRGWLGELVEVRGGDLQLAAYVAVAAGARRSLDDWIAVDRWPAFTRLADRLGLAVEADCVFHPLDGDRPAGVELSPTTRARATPLAAGLGSDPRAAVHAFVSSRRDWAEEALACGWYSVAVGGRVVFKPLADFHRLGFAFGYPRCCVDFFLEHNDWPRSNSLAEALRRSNTLCWQTNRLLKSTPWMLVFHLPCAFDCSATREQGDAVIAALAEIDPPAARRVERRLRQMFLVFSERAAFLLAGAERLGARRARYRRVVPLQRETSVQAPRERGYARVLTAGDELRIEDGTVHVLAGGRLRGTIESRCDLGVAEVPLLLDFR